MVTAVDLVKPVGSDGLLSRRRLFRLAEEVSTLFPIFPNSYTHWSAIVPLVGCGLPMARGRQRSSVCVCVRV